jgi:hypothetical protein
VPRDFVSEMRKIIDAETSAGPAYSTPVVARRITAALRAEDPDLLFGWLNSQAESLILDAINYRDRSARAYARRTSDRRRFADAVAAYTGGDTEAMAQWLAVPFTVDGGTRKRLADMEAADLLFAAGGYTARARENAMTAAFLRALAGRVGAGAVRDHYTNEQLSTLWRSLRTD